VVKIPDDKSRGQFSVCPAVRLLLSHILEHIEWMGFEVYGMWICASLVVRGGTQLDIDFTGYVSIGFAKIISFCHPRYYKITYGRRSQK